MSSDHFTIEAPMQYIPLLTQVSFKVIQCASSLSSLFRFKHPSEGALCALAGKQMPKPNRRDRCESWGEGTGG